MSTLTRRLAALILLASPFWAAPAALARQNASWPAAVRLVFELQPGADADETVRVAQARLDRLRPQRTDAFIDDAGRLVVRLRNAADRDLAAGVVGQPGEFRITLVASDDPARVQAALADQSTLPEGQILAPLGDRFEPYLLVYAPGATDVDDSALTGSHIVRAEAATNPANGAAVVNFELDAAGGRALTRLTTTHVRERIAVVLDGQVLMAPTVSTPLTDGAGSINGGFSPEVAQALAAIMGSGPLPAPVTLVEETAEE